MASKRLSILFIAISILSISVTTQNINAASLTHPNGKWGIGPCPRVTPMNEFDITEIMGDPWYMIAHYSDSNYFGRHCHTTTFFDGNPGEDICRVIVNKTVVKYDGEVVEPSQFSFMTPSEDEPATFVYNIGGTPLTIHILGTDYNQYLVYHSCNPYPRDNPIMHEQLNYIFSKAPVWQDGFKSFVTALKIFESNGIDTSHFVLMDQEKCIHPR